MDGPHRIFAYGSLMWRPDFQFVRARPARLEGYHRRLSVFSHHYRGTPDCPGLVLGLDEGGTCDGLLYEIAPENWPQIYAKIHAREMLGDVYVEAILPITIINSKEQSEAMTYVANRESKQFAPEMPVKELLGFIDQGQGTMGSCRQYVANTIRHLRELGIHDEGLERLAHHVI